jgi:heat shock protein HslJ
MNKSALIIFFFISLPVTGCSPNKDTTDVRIHDIWVLESIEGKSYTKGPEDESHPMIEIHLKEERLFGHTGCNDLYGTVKVTGSNITFSDIITTKMACPGDTEMRFLFALKEVNNYKIEKMRLYLFDDDKEVLVFKKID